MQHLYIRQGMLALLLGLLLLGAACAGAPAAAPVVEEGAAASGELELTDVSMRFQWIAQWQFAGYIVAEVKGYYDEVGLNVTLNGGGPDFPVKQLVASGADDFGTAWVDSMYLSQQQDIPLKALATLFQTSPSAYMVHADSGIAGVEDFPGKTVAMYYGGGVETEYRAMLLQAGVDRDEMQEVPGQFSLEPFIQRRIDVLPVYATDQPNVARKQGVDFELILPRDYGVVIMGDVLFATSEFIEQHPNTVQAFVSASLRGWQWAIENPEESVELIAAYNQELDPEQLAFEAEKTIELLTYRVGRECVGWNDPAAWAAEQELLLELDILEEPVAMDAVATNRFVDVYYQAQGIDCAAEASTR